MHNIILTGVVRARAEKKYILDWARKTHPALFTALPTGANDRRMFSFVISRFLLWKLMGIYCIVQHNDDKKPFIVGRIEKISLSHSGEAAAAWIGSHPGGIDIQKTDNRILKAGSHFLSQDQLKGIKTLPDDPARRYYLLKVWTIKEAVFKAAPHPVNYSEGIVLSRPELFHNQALKILYTHQNRIFCHTVMHFCNGEYHLALTA